MLSIIDRSLDGLLRQTARKLTDDERMVLFLGETVGMFTRKDYINRFKELSSATAGRDLKKAVEKNRIRKYGDKKQPLTKKDAGNISSIYWTKIFPFSFQDR